MPNITTFKFKVYLGKHVGFGERIYLTGFSWDCNWYWGGAYIETKSSHSHFDGNFLNNIVPSENKTASWFDLDRFVQGAQYDSNAWWRIKDLYKQFYTYRDAAECFQYGGHMTTAGRSKGEISKIKANSMNKHIENVIIPEIIKALAVTTHIPSYNSLMDCLKDAYGTPNASIEGLEKQALARAKKGLKLIREIDATCEARIRRMENVSLTASNL